MKRAAAIRKALLLGALFLLGGVAAPEQAMAQCATNVSQGGPNVLYRGCTQATTGGATSLSVTNPPGTAAGDVLIATIATDGNTAPAPNAPAGWTLVNSGNSAGEVSLAVWIRTASSGPGTSHTFSWAGSEAAVATLMRFTGTLAGTVTSAGLSGSSANATTPAITTAVNNSLILRLAGVDRQSLSVPGSLSAVTAVSGGNGGNSMGYAAGFVNLATAGTSAALNFGSNNDQWRTVTLALRPFFPATRFRIAHDGGADTCSLESITLSARDVNGNIVPNYTGTVTLSAPNGDWFQNGAPGTFSNGAAGDGIATYTFTAGDNGTVTLQYTPSAAGTLDIDVTDGSISAPDNAGADDPQLSAQRCGFVIQHDGSAGTCGYELITLRATKPDGTTLRDTPFTGTVTINTSTNNGVWSLGTASGSIVSQSNGNLQYSFGAGDNNVAVLRFTDTTVETVNFDAVQGAVDVQLGTDAGLDVGLCSFVFTHAGSGDNCSVQSVTLTVRDPGGNTALGYTGTVSLGTDTGLGLWLQGGATNVPDNNPIPGDGNATYVFAAADNGSVTFGFTHDDPVPVTLSATDASLSITTSSSPPLAISACSFRISFSGAADKCTAKSITFTVVDGSGATITNYSGSVTLSTNPANGSWAQNGGTANGASFSDDGNGSASYTFTAADAGDITLAYSNAVNSSANFNITDGLLVPDPMFDPSLTINDCEFRISHSGSSDICSLEPVTFTLHDSSGAVATNYTGTISLSTSSAHGSWLDYDGAGAGVNALNNLGNGSATYQMAAGDQGSATFYFSPSVIETLDFNVTNGSSTEDSGGAFDPVLSVMACTPRANAVQCVNGSSTSISIPGGTTTNDTRAVVLITGYEGTTAVSGATFNGVAMSPLAAVQNTGNPSNSRTQTEMFYLLDASLPDQGGSYTGTFTADSGQSMCLVALQNVRQETPASATGEGNGGSSATTQIVTALDDSLVLSALTENNGTDFGASSLGTRIFELAGGSGDWIFTGSAGLAAAAGNAGVTESSQGGAGLGRWTQVLAAFAPAPAPLAYFEISHDLSATACTQQAITITAFDVNGNVKTDYTGTVSLSITAPSGTWSQGSAANAPANVTAGGTADYTFAPADNGSATLNLLAFEDYNVDVAAGAVTESAGADEDVIVGVCQPVVDETQCYTGTSGSVTIPSNALSGTRAVILSVARESSPANDPSLANVQFNGQPMSLVRSEKFTNAANTLTNTTEMWVVFDAALPAAGGGYNASFGSSSGSFPNTPGMCLTAVHGVAQTVPAGTSVNGTGGTTQSMETTITPDSNNALVLSIVSDDRGAGSYVVSSLATRLWNNQNPPANARFGGSYGFKPSSGPLSVTDLASSAVQIHTHIVAAFAPAVAGNPTASGYVPVTLAKTFSGPVNYRAYGNTLRAEPNGGDACAMIDPAVGSSVAVDLPPGSTVLGSYLYWAGSGNDSLGHTDADVALNGLPITADEIFLIDNVGNEGNRDYFAGFKDVTTVVAGDGTYTLTDMTAQGGAPWNGSDSCAAGWAIVVVYENTAEDLHVINLFHGFQPFQSNFFTLVPRNFRIAANDVLDGGHKPYGQLTHITLEGDETISDGDESLGLQAAPGSLSFTDRLNVYNPASAQYNSTVTQPEYDANLDFTGNYLNLIPGTGGRLGDSYGLDVDTHYLAGSMVGDPLYEFGVANPLPEHITTRYAAGGDLVLLIGEVISITNAPIADIELSKTQGDPFVVGGTSSYTLTVSNNGDRNGPGGAAAGTVTLTDTLPAGLAITSVATTEWTCANDTQALTCEYDIGATYPGGALPEGASLPPVTVNVAIGDDSVFPDLNNQVSNVARALYSGGGCTPQPLGVSPDPGDCAVSPEFDNVQDLEGGALSMNDLVEKSVNNNNVDGVTTTITGRRTDLRIDKAVDGVLQEASEAQYSITVTNLGPDTANKTITVTDVLPAGLSFDGPVPDPEWSCGILSQTLTCTYDAALAPLAPAASVDFTLPVTLGEPAIENATVNNTASVDIASGNFDTVAGNDSDMDSTVVAGEPAAAQEQFLISVNLDATTLGGLTFDKGDIILYDPDSDVATMFFDNSAVAGDVKDIDAFHVRRNGHILMSTREAASSIMSVTFEPGDLVVYDPILQTASLLLSGAAVFTSGSENIDAVFEQDNGLLVLSTTDDAQIGALAFDRSDLVEYNNTSAAIDGLAPGEARLLLDGDGAAVFNADVQLSDVYLREGADEVYVMTIGQTTANIATGSTTFTGDDIASYDATNMTSRIEFRGSVPNGVFDPLTSLRFIDGVHLVEEGYFGHFSIVEEESGDTCHPTRIRISKHIGLTHEVDETYTGSIRISAPAGAWSLVEGDGTLTQSGGDATYTYQAGDLGSVVLELAVEDPASFEIDVSNTLAAEVEPGAEDPTFNFSDISTLVSYADNFSSGGFSGNTGTSSWAAAWSETDAVTAGPAGGQVYVSGGEAYFRNRPSAQTQPESMPALVRTVDLSLYTPTEPLSFSFNWRTAGANSGDSFLVQARGSSGDAWTTLESFTGLSGAASGSRNYDLGSFGITPSATTQVRFRVGSGYSVSGDFIIDNVSLNTGTTDCGVGSVHHYEIIHAGSGVMCEAYPITFVAHDVAHTPIAPGLNTQVTLSTSLGRGTWSQAAGHSAPVDLVPGDGVATYTFGLNETTAVVNFNLTDPASNPEPVNFNIFQGVLTEMEESPFNFYEAGFIFTNGLDSQLLGTQIAGKNSTTLPFDASNSLFIKAVRTDDQTLECEALFGNQTVNIEFGAECKNPSSCASGVVRINGSAIPTSTDDGQAGSVAADIPVGVTFDAGSSAELVFNYNDAGRIQLSAEYDIPFNNGVAGLQSGDFMRGLSNPFVVRPFGLDIDLSGNAGSPTASAAADANVFRKAGENFSVNIRAVAYDETLDESSDQDLDNDGHPDAGADLSGNALTSNFGQEGVPESVTLSADVLLPLEHVNPGLQGTISFSGFAGGQKQNADISFPEVGIIELSADLDNAAGYLGSGVDLVRSRADVGRFAPHHYAIAGASFSNRGELSCSPASTFTYMGEGMGVVVDLEAQNADGDLTRNYHEGFERLLNLNQLGFGALDQDGAANLTARLDTGSMTLEWGDSFNSGMGNTGTARLEGSLVLQRDGATNGAPDGPFGTFKVGLLPNDGEAYAGGISLLPAALDMDLDSDAVNDRREILQSALRYGRLILHNAYGSEIADTPDGEDLEVTLRAEFWDGSQWALNADDSCTPYDSDGGHLFFVSGSQDGALASSPEAAAVVGGHGGTLLGGLTSVNSTSADTDSPLYITAPGAGLDGSALIELDLDGLGLDFLGFDWRDTLPDGFYTDNPRARVEFGTYQGHNRVINWQEIVAP